MRAKWILFLFFIGMIGTGAGCRKNAVDKNAFKTALNNYYSGRQECVWAAPVKFPAQADASNDEQTKGFDALTDQGLLKRTPEEKKRFLIGSKQVNDYDLSDKGRSTWKVDASQPGYGNFCYGHADVTSIDNFTPAQNTGATQYSVTYHFAVTQLADWANTAEMRTAFPKIATDTSGEKTAAAILTKSENGWIVENVQTPVSGLPTQ
ncbi:MAG: hypothetical protein WBE76_30620 [Terracidiphilus sp.]